MFELGNVMSGTVTACSPENELTVQLDNGATGYVPCEEALCSSRKVPAKLDWMIGQKKNFCLGDIGEDGRYELSARAYEEYMYQRVAEDFQNKVRNVYSGKLEGISPDGKLAFYRVAQGVSVYITVTNFNRLWLNSYREISMPSEIPLVISGIGKQGRLYGSAVPAFGDFRSNVEKLQLAEGSIVDGYVSSEAHKVGGVIVGLSPNLTVRVPHARVGDWVRMEITGVNMEEQRIRARVIGRSDSHPSRMDCRRWLVPMEELPDYIDLDEFGARLCPRERTAPLPEATGEQAGGLDALLNKLDGRTPFGIREGETGVRMPLNYGTPQKISHDCMAGRLTDVHMAAAKAVNALKYSTLAQLKEYLRLQANLSLTDTDLREVVNRLVRRDIVHVLNIMDGERESVPCVLYPGVTNYYHYTGMRRYLPAWQYNTEPDVSLMKCYLSSNELLLGMMRREGQRAELEARVYILTDDGLRIRPRYRMRREDRLMYLESARSNWLDGMMEKLQRYAKYFDMEQEDADVYITLETPEEADALADRVAEMQLKYDVYLTCDAECANEPVFRHVPAYVPAQKGFFVRFRRWMHM